ncbi:MAG: glycoside hydrolase family 43 protein [Phycisphaeraceae bacterium]|nr:glycoside hydrolase family 43 protein [Phycisphaeraceae bacterium]
MRHATPLALSLILTPSLLVGCSALDADERHSQVQKIQRRLPESMRAARTTAPGENDWYILAYFRDPKFNKAGEFGLYLATSRDGYTWQPANLDRPLFVPRVGTSSGMRDPCIAQGPDGVFHCVWTWETGDRRSIGYARSTDLITWTDIRSLKVMPDTVSIDYCWAPEIIWDPASTHWVLAWSCAIEGLNPATEKQAEWNHRMYYSTTRDFRTLSPYQSLFDPGYPSIDPAWIELPPDWIAKGLTRPADSESIFDAPAAGPATPSDPGRWLLLYKDERQWPEKKQIRAVRGLTPIGPFGTPSASLTIHWVEAPSAQIIDGNLVIYYDEYREGRYGAIRSNDLFKWEDVQNLMSFPPLTRHGSVIRVTPAQWQRVHDRR